MKTIDALKALYEALGGSDETVASVTLTRDVLNAIADFVGGDDDAKLTADAIANIAAKGSAIYVPTGKKSITGTSEVDVKAYATAQVSDSNLKAANIISGKTILGVAGSAVVPTGNVNITGTAAVDVTAYASAQVVDANLIADNIKSGVTILGVEGTYAGDK